MVLILQRAFACFSCQGVNSLEAAAKQRKAHSRLNLRQKLIPLKIGPGAVLENYECYPDITQGMMLYIIVC